MTKIGMSVMEVGKKYRLKPNCEDDFRARLPVNHEIADLIKNKIFTVIEITKGTSEVKKIRFDGVDRWFKPGWFSCYDSKYFEEVTLPEDLDYKALLEKVFSRTKIVANGCVADSLESFVLLVEGLDKKDQIQEYKRQIAEIEKKIAVLEGQ